MESIFPCGILSLTMSNPRGAGVTAFCELPARVKKQA
jgi:hypothetical protein